MSPARHLLLLGLALWGAPGARASAAPDRVLGLCYHAVEDADPDQRFVGVSTAKLVAQFSWLRRNGYHPVRLDDVLAARDGRATLPAKPVLITFDDGYASFYTRAFPILKAFGYPAILAVIGSWMAAPPGSLVMTSPPVPREMVLTWDQVREVARSGLVEIAAHSYDLHHGVLANPQGNLEPGATTRQFDAASGTYETERAFEARLQRDAQAVRELIAREVGTAPRVMVWPYGEHSRLAISIFGSAGAPITLGLADGLGSVAALEDLPRYLVADDPTLASFVTEVHGAEREGARMSLARVSLDAVQDPDPERQDRNVGRLVQRIRDLRVGTVVLQAFADLDGSGVPTALYFPNRVLPVRADLLNRVAWQLRTRAGVEVYAWLPVRAWPFGDVGDAGARERVLTAYEDLARSAAVAGLYFGEDAGDLADGAGDLTRLLAEHARWQRTPLRTMRAVSVRGLAAPDASARLARELDAALRAHDRAALALTPIVAGATANAADAALRDVAALVERRPGGLARTVFELPAVDARQPADAAARRIPPASLARWARLLAARGARALGFVDDPLHDGPDAPAVRAQFSLQSYPYEP